VPALIRFHEEALELLNGGHFQISDPGPLFAPIRDFTLHRDDKLVLTLETRADRKAESSAVEHPPGALRYADDRVKLVNLGGFEAELIGVIGYSTSIYDHASGLDSCLRETARVHRLSVSPGDPDSAVHTIDWLENFPRKPFMWPDLFSSVTRTTTARTIAGNEDGITICGSSENSTGGRSAAKITIDEMVVYICGLREEAGSTKPGCIIYLGTPDSGLRKKVRTALSLALGAYLIELGHTLYDNDWRIVSATSKSAYTLGGRAFDIGPDQLAPLGPTYLHEVDRNELARFVNALVRIHDDIDLGNLAWAFWHACSAPVHIAPAHFGAAIEALQRAYIKSNAHAVSGLILPRDRWKSLRGELETVVNEVIASDQDKRALMGKLANLNRMDQRPLLKSIFDALGLELGAEEDAAWGRRNQAAHGMPIREGEEHAAIQDMRLLRGVFQRLLLRISMAADRYVDYASPEHPYRLLEQPPQSAE
jgi:hypothetical protein